MADNFSPVLAALKAVLVDIDPSPEPVPTAIMIFPDEYDEKLTNDFPYILISQNYPDEVEQSHHTLGKARHDWEIEVLVVLGNELGHTIQAALELTKHRPWPEAMGTILFANLQLQGTVSQIGSPDGTTLARYRLMHLNPYFVDSIHWGLQFLIPVRQRPIFTRGV